MAVFLSPVGGAAAQFFDNNGIPLAGGLIYTYAAGTSTPAATYTSSTGGIQHSNPIILDAAGRVPTGEIWLDDTLAYKFILKTAQDVLVATYDNITGINSNFVAYTSQQEIQTATAGQTVFTLTTMQYQPNTNNLSVFVDGVNQYGPGAQYAFVETDSETVTFVTGLHVGASVKFTTASPVATNVVNAENVSYTYPSAGSVTQSVENRLAQYVSVEDFGAVGDGVTDDTVAFANAIAALGAIGGGTLYAPKTYNVPTYVKITTSNFVLDGLGTGKILSSGTTYDAIWTDTNLTNLTVKNISIQIPTTNLRSGGMCLAFNVGCQNIRVSNVNTLGGVAGIWCLSCTNVLVEGCFVNTPKADGIHFGQGSKQCKAIGNTVYQAGDDSFATSFDALYSAGRPSDIVFANNIAKNSIWGFGVATYGADRVTITGNEFYNMALGGVTVTDTAGTTVTENAVIANNHMDTLCRADVVPYSYWNGTPPEDDPPITSEQMKSAINVNANYVQCVGNKISNVTSATNESRRGALFGQVAAISFTSNYFFNVNGDGIYTGTQVISEISLCNNIFDSVLGVGIRCSNSQYNTSISINNNSMGYGQTIGTDQHMLIFTFAGTVNGWIYITNNSCSGGRSASIYVGSATNIVAVNNNPT